MAKILIIDDEKSIRYTLKEILEYEKYEVSEAKDGEEGLNMIEQNDYDIVLCDVKMPKLDGLQVLSRAMEFGKDTVTYNASAFKTKVGDVVEDLLKKLPGIEVERDGSVKAFGENVKNVLCRWQRVFWERH